MEGEQEDSYYSTSELKMISVGLNGKGLDAIPARWLP